MTVGKAAALTAALVGAVAVGVAIGPTVRDTWSDDKAPVATTAPARDADAAAVKTERPVRRAAPARTREIAPATEIAPAKKSPDTIEAVAVEMWEPEFRDRVKDVLNKGAKPELAAADFSNAEQFMTVAHAARNTQVPFAVLKHHVLNEGRTLADAIHEFKPQLDAKAEVTKARDAARADLNLTD
jgi:hypothetical protein